MYVFTRARVIISGATFYLERCRFPPQTHVGEINIEQIKWNAANWTNVKCKNILLRQTLSNVSFYHLYV